MNADAHWDTWRNCHFSEITAFYTRDFSAAATRLHGKATTNEKQAAFALQMVRRPHVDPERFAQVWDEAHALMDTYRLAP